MVKLFRLTIISCLVMLLATACATSNYDEEEEYSTPVVESVAFSPDGNYALWIFAGDIHMGDVASGKEIRTFSGAYAGNSVVFSPDGRYALSGSQGGTMRLWDVATGKKIRTFSGHTGSVNSVAFSPNGKYALSGSDDDTLKLWDVASGKEIRTFSCDGAVHSVAFSPNGQYVLAGGSHTLRLWAVGR